MSSKTYSLGFKNSNFKDDLGTLIGLGVYLHKKGTNIQTWNILRNSLVQV